MFIAGKKWSWLVNSKELVFPKKTFSFSSESWKVNLEPLDCAHIDVYLRLPGGLVPVQITDASNLWRRSMGNMLSVWPLQELEKEGSHVINP